MLYYPTFYEGLEQSKERDLPPARKPPRQILGPALDWNRQREDAKTFLSVALDYIWPHVPPTRLRAKATIENVLGGTVGR